MLPERPMRSLALLPALAFAALIIAPAGCLSPTLPLPPPEISSVSQGSTAGSWTVSGDCIAGAVVAVVDGKTGQGAAFEDLHETGFFTVTIQGAQCDLVQVTQWVEDGDQELSSETTIVLQAMADGEPVDPTACGQ
jgi:hypothetical protein